MSGRPISSASAWFDTAYAAHRAGRLAEAIHGYEAALAADPAHLDAIHLLGLAHHQQGRHEHALDLFERAISQAADHPAHAGMLLNRGHALKALRRHDAALASYRAALTVQPDFALAHYNLGNLLAEQNQHAAAAAAFRAAIQLQPQNAAAHNNLGNALAAQGARGEAIAAFETALRLAPDSAGAHNNLGIALSAEQRVDEAIEHYRAALRIAPNFVQALLNLGNALDASGASRDALGPLTHAVHLAPELAAAHYALGNALSALGRHAEACTHFQQALTIEPDFALAYQNLGCSRFELGEFDAAAQAFDSALRLRPELAIARYNRSFIHLQHGEYAAGWRDYEARLVVWQPDEYAAHFDTPRWLGDGVPYPEAPPMPGTTSATGQTLLLHAEQGFGDTLQFVRLVPSVVRRGIRVVLEVQAPLAPLLADTAQRWGVTLIGQGTPRPHFDCHCPLPSLPLALGLDAQGIGASAAPYLHAPAAMRERWKSLAAASPNSIINLRAGTVKRRRTPIAMLTGALRTLRKSRTLRLGLVWSGRIRARGENRAIAFAALEPLFKMEHVDWYLLQPEIAPADRATLDACLPRYPRVHDCGPLLHDFADTAALIEQLDGVVSIDTSTAHLAGALGKTVWLMLPFVADWRWGISGTHNAWYPSMNLYRQTALGANAWSDVIARVRSDLLQRAEPRPRRN